MLVLAQQATMCGGYNRENETRCSDGIEKAYKSYLVNFLSWRVVW